MVTAREEIWQPCSKLSCRRFVFTLFGFSPAAVQLNAEPEGWEFCPNMARYSPFLTDLDPVRKLPVRTAVTVLVTVVVFKCLFSCPCVRPQETAVHCWLFLLLPLGILLFALSLVDPQLLKLCQCYVCRCCGRTQSRCCAGVECCCCAAGYCHTPTQCCGDEAAHCSALVGSFLRRAVCASALWIVAALLDADWYVCIRTVSVNGTGQQQLACKDFPTPEEAETLRRYSSESRVGHVNTKEEFPLTEK